MQSIKSPPRISSSQYHFCVRITPKVLSKYIFQSKRIQTLYKVQIDKGNKRQTYEVMKRNLHQQALQGYYKSQNCYFTLTNYSNSHPIEMKITFSEVNSPQQQEVIFVYKFSTFGIVKNFLENGVRRSTHVVTKDFQTEFYIDFYVQNNKARLQDKVKSDSNKQILQKKHFKQANDEQKDSQRYKRSQSNYSPSKSSHRAQSTFNQRNPNMSFTVPNTRTSTPMENPNIPRRRSLMNQSFDNARSQKFSHSRDRNFSNPNLNMVSHQKMFYKKRPSSRLSYGDFVKQDDQGSLHQNRVFSKFSTNLQNKSSKISQKTTIKFQSSQKRKAKNSSQKGNLDLKLFLSIKDISLDQISFKIKKNIIAIIFVSIVFFIVCSKTIDSLNFGEKIVTHQNHRNNNFHFQENQQEPQNTIPKRRAIKNKKAKKPKQQDLNQQEKRKVSNKKKKAFKGVKSF